MNKLRRYSAVTKTGIETVCLDADVSALEAARKKWEAKEKQYAAHEQRLREIAKRLRHSTKCNIHAACYGPIEPCDCGLQDLRAILNRKQEKQP